MRIVRFVKDAATTLCLLYALVLAAMGLLLMSKEIIEFIQNHLSQ